MYIDVRPNKQIVWKHCALRTEAETVTELLLHPAKPPPSWQNTKILVSMYPGYFVFTFVQWEEVAIVAHLLQSMVEMQTPESTINGTTMHSWCLLQLSVFASISEYILASERRVKGVFYWKVKRPVNNWGVAFLALSLWLHYLFISLVIGKTQVIILKP